MRKCSRSLPIWVSRLWWRTVFLTLVLIIGYAKCARAQDEEPELPSAAELSTQCAPEVQTSRRAELTHEGVDGFWFQGDVTRCLLRRYSTLLGFARRVELLEDRLALQGDRDVLTARQVALAVQEAEAATGALEAAVRRAREAEEARDAWYRAPLLWFAVGGVVVVVLEVVAIWAFSELLP